MGACMSGGLSEEQKTELQRNKELEEQNQKDAEAEAAKVKLLLLGAGESGKSTVFKQMKILYGAPPTDEERRQFTHVVYSNVIAAMKILCEQAVSLGEMDKIERKDSYDIVVKTDDDAEIDLTLGGHINALWHDAGIKAVWARKNEFQIIEAVSYYFNKVDEIMQPGYLANQQDILLARARTIGIVEERYIIDGTTFEIYDVGGQRNERKKWIHCFENVTAVIFVAALSEYDMMLYEDANTNRMVESINLFDEICNNRFFTESAVILFLNKRDLFAEKIKRVDIKSIPPFVDFDGGLGDYEKGCQYFLKKFKDKNKSETKEIYHHITCATDTENVNVVFNACKDIILRSNMAASGMF